MPHANDLTIGLLSHRSGCSAPTIRYYEHIGLLPAAVRRSGGHRVYSETDLRRLIFIRRCRNFGFAIEQIKAFMTFAEKPEQDCAAVRDLAGRHLGEVRRKLGEMRALERGLKLLVAECDEQCAGGPAENCVILADWTTPNGTSCCRSSVRAR